ncbi:FecCD family ABC transporter permease [Balneatrix alpica]|uniref:FecCD family ABC transporter permease n=1 Tax=Balneatrix alpica TaxID=75684 RepID=UPI002739915F|nr:iron ABC transporter permease [Balneatrix alpica]
MAERPFIRLMALLAGAVLLAMLLSLLLSPGGTLHWPNQGWQWQLLLEVRLPRTLLTLLCGASLGLAGAALQGYLHNPLAEPGLLGISSWAGLGAVLVFYFGPVATLAWWLPAGGIIGALISLTALSWLAGRHPSVSLFILAGVALASLGGALMSLALNLAPNPFAALEVIFWLLGSTADRSLEQVLLILPPVLLGNLLLLRLGPALYAWSLGQEAATSLGINPHWLRRQILLGCGLSVGSCVAMSGGIGFVGLVVPHLLRPWLRQRPDALLAASALGGALLLLLADLGVRLLPTGTELKLGVLTALIGAPVFFQLLLQKKRELW